MKHQGYVVAPPSVHPNGQATDAAARAFPDAYRSMIRRLAAWEGRA